MKQLVVGVVVGLVVTFVLSWKRHTAAAETTASSPPRLPVRALAVCTTRPQATDSPGPRGASLKALRPVSTMGRLIMAQLSRI
jgi:hypothetical protein